MVDAARQGEGGLMLIAQITDVHLGFEPGNPRENNRVRLDRVLDALCNGPNRPDLLLVTGDITEHGDRESYERFAEAVAGCPFPVVACVGNHDDRANFAAAFPQHPLDGGFAHCAISLDGFRLIVLDTLEPGRQGGAFCEVRAAWLAARLDEDRSTPTLIVMHHPPFDAGIAWMITDPREPWVARFADAVAGHDQIVAILCGHLHRAIVAPWRGVTTIVCPATAPELALDLRPIDPEAPDERPMVVADPPGYALHRWTPDGLVTHFETAEGHGVLARFDAAMQPLVRQIQDERPG
jgi:3',5'-cyclic AMP phosphodiesterase CpdA